MTILGFYIWGSAISETFKYSLKDFKYKRYKDGCIVSKVHFLDFTEIYLIPLSFSVPLMKGLHIKNQSDPTLKTSNNPQKRNGL